MDGHELSPASRDAHLTLRRVERQQRLIEILAATRGRRTVASLARDLRVTPRTVERDVERLREAGVPITARPGPGGGLRLDVDPGIRRVELTAAEVAALLASLSSLGPTTTDAASSATAALVAALRHSSPGRPGPGR